MGPGSHGLGSRRAGPHHGSEPFGEHASAAATQTPAPLPPRHQVEERKNSHINELMRQHEAAFAEIKAYYSDITANNLDLIKARPRGANRRFADFVSGVWRTAGPSCMSSSAFPPPYIHKTTTHTRQPHKHTQALKEDVAEMKKREAQNEKLM